MKAGAIAATTVTATSLNGQGSPNLLRNPDFEVAQRGTSFATATANAYTLDGFIFSNGTDAVCTITQDTDVPTFAQAGHQSLHSFKLQVTTVDASIAAGQVMAITQNMEGYDIYPAVGKSLTLSFWVKAKKTGVYCCGFVNSGVDRSMVKEYTINVADTWEKKTVTFVMNASGGTWVYNFGLGLRVYFTLATGSTYQTTKDAWQTGYYFGTSSQVNALDSTANYINLAQVKLEIGATVTPFVPRAYGEELARNQRYLYRRTGGVAPIIGTGRCISTISAYICVPFPTTMRITPTLATINASTFTLVSGTLTSYSLNAISSPDMGVLTLVTTGTIGGDAIMMYGNAATDYVDFIAEL